MDVLLDVWDSLLFLVRKLGLLLQYLIKLNYEIVSLVLDVLSGVLFACTNLVTGIRVALLELAEQYGDWCAVVCKMVAWVLQGIVSAISSLITFSTSVATWIGLIFYYILISPVVIWNNVCDGLAFLYIKLEQTINMPAHLVVMLLEGFALIWRGVWAAIVTILSGVYQTICGMFSLGLGGVKLAAGFGRDGTIMILTSPLVAAKKVGTFFASIPVESCLGLLVVVVVVYLWQRGTIPTFLDIASRIASKVLRWIFGIMLNMAARFWIFVFTVAEQLLGIFAPYLAFAIRIIRWGYRPALRALCWLYSICVWLTRRRSSTGNNAPNHTQSADLNETQERLLCVVCQDEEKSVMLEPCKHICMCKNCADEILVARGIGRKCPMCRTYVRSAVDVFI